MLLAPEDATMSLVQRVVAGPGDVIRSVAGQLIRNGASIEDAFVTGTTRSNDTWGPYAVPRGYYFVMGDNRAASVDSRVWGFVPEKYIVGLVRARWWPLSRAHLF